MPIKKIGIVGLGLLGKGIATCCLSHRYQVIAYDKSEESRPAACQFISQAMRDLVERSSFDPSLPSEWREHFVQANSLSEFKSVDLVIETVTEDLPTKSEIYDHLESILPDHTPIASNTSAIPITQLQAERRHPERFLGMHWSENAHATRFMEIIPGAQTAESYLDSIFQFARSIGKEPAVLEKDIEGFICNRIGYAMYREAVYLLESGIADVETIDRSVRNAFGLWAAMCGPFRWMDITGGPALYAKSIERVLPTLCNVTTLPKTMQRVIEEDKHGLESGSGYYEYDLEDIEKWKTLFCDSVWHIKKFQDRHFPIDKHPVDEGRLGKES